MLQVNAHASCTLLAHDWNTITCGQLNTGWNMHYDNNHDYYFRMIFQSGTNSSNNRVLKCPWFWTALYSHNIILVQYHYDYTLCSGMNNNFCLVFIAHNHHGSLSSFCFIFFCAKVVVVTYICRQMKTMKLNFIVNLNCRMTFKQNSTVRSHSLQPCHFI